MNLGRIETERKSGVEPLHANGTPLGVSLQEFWQWSGSDLISNSQRGILAEFLVAIALGNLWATGVKGRLRADSRLLGLSLSSRACITTDQNALHPSVECISRSISALRAHRSTFHSHTSSCRLARNRFVSAASTLTLQRFLAMPRRRVL